MDLWRKLSATADAQVWEYQATHEDMANTRLTLINNVADAYFNIAYLNEAIELAQKSLKQYQEINRIANAKFRYGRADSSQPTQAKQSFAERGKQPVVFTEQLDTQKQVLRNLLNLRPSENMAADPAQFRLLPVKGVNLDVPITVFGQPPRPARRRIPPASVATIGQRAKTQLVSIDYFGCKSEYVFR